jgi:predicted 3-demethylubiquinone-9 3-methyltransferase (glyoxalase superfamily)
MSLRICVFSDLSLAWSRGYDRPAARRSSVCESVTIVIVARLSTMLMFEGDAGAAIELYTSVFAGSRVEQIELYGPDGPGAEGTVEHATVTLGGQTLRCIDSAVEHPFGFTPAISLFVELDGEAELDSAYAELSAGGAVLMPLGTYPFSSRFAWIADRFGVSWQLSLA